VFGWLTKLVVGLGVVGVVGLDAFACVGARFGVQDSADRAGRAAATSWQSTRTLQSAYDAALAQAVVSGDTIDTASFAASVDGAVTLTLHREATTLVLHRIPPLRQLREASATVVSRPAR
jgi:hypothetical protein